MNIVFLGTASCFPTPHRGVSCTALRFEDGITWLFDCGEGSQIQLQKSILKASKITKIFITHLHGDHLFGLPGLICTIGSQCPDRTDFILEIYGPHGLRKYVREALSLSRSPLPFSYVVHELVPVQEQYPDDWATWEVNHTCDDIKHLQELTGRDITPENNVWDVCADGHRIVKAGPILHRVPCFGYVVAEEDKPGTLLVDKLRELGVNPGPLYSQLKQGKSIKNPSGHTIEPSEVLGPPKKGRKVTILGDTHDPSRMTRLAMNSDVLIHEATMEDALNEKAIAFGHSTPSMAAHFAQSIIAKKLILFHFSQRFRGNDKEDDLKDPHVSNLLKEALSAFGDNKSCEVILAEDLLTVTVEHVKS